MIITRPDKRKWFAWYPVHIGVDDRDPRYAWLQWVWRIGRGLWTHHKLVQ